MPELRAAVVAEPGCAPCTVVQEERKTSLCTNNELGFDFDGGGAEEKLRSGGLG